MALSLKLTSEYYSIFISQLVIPIERQSQLP